MLSACLDQVGVPGLEGVRGSFKAHHERLCDLASRPLRMFGRCAASWYALQSSILHSLPAPIWLQHVAC